MKLAYLVTGYVCGHDYGVDNLFTGLVNVLGFANVLDWPEKPPLHCAVAERTHFDVPQRDGCNIDSDSAHPLRGTTPYDILEADLAIIAMPPYCPDAYLAAEVCRALPRSTPIAALDASDRIENHAPWYQSIAGRPLAGYFKREYPIGAQWPGTFPCPLSYPASRVPALEWEQKRGLFYHATDHGGSAPGVPRQLIAEQLVARIAYARLPEPTMIREMDGTAAIRRLVDGGFDLSLTRSQENRLSPEQYHERMAQALIGISWNGAVNQDANRTWENLAHGLCQVAERPRIQIPHVPLDGVHCFYADTPEGIAQAAWSLLSKPDMARRVARAGHEHFLQHHSSEARARYVLEILGQQGG